MARIFRYRYVDVGTSFTGDPRCRVTRDESPATLFANEVATDIGGTCWGAIEPLPVIDHHFLRDAQFPSASAAVLHKAAELRRRFADQTGDLWLVTHTEPDFDAFCSMYLARWVISEESAAGIDWIACGLHPDGWLSLEDGRKIDWFTPDLTAVPPEHRWAFQLASYASALEARRLISSPRQHQLRSVLYAALKRGRDYLSESSGATDFFDEARAALAHGRLNPAFDSVLQTSSLFAPELAMLEREAEAYQRDMARARRSTVYLPESEAPTPDFFKNPKEIPFHDPRRPAELNAEHLLLADTFRIPTDGIYLRDPECLLFKEWARLDLENSALGTGFEFTAVAHSNGRPEASSNKTAYEFSIDPERANGRHLYTVWSRLQTQEVECLRAHDQNVVVLPVGTSARRAAGAATATLGALLADPWLGGQSRSGCAVATPQRGTLIGPPGTRSDLRDDPVVEAVRTELENSIYSAVSLVAGPQVTVFDLAGSKEGVDIAPQRFDLNSPLEIPASPETYFRFAQIRLRSDVPIAAPNLGRQIAETLWQVLYSDMPGSTPPEFMEKQVVLAATSVGVWGDRGIAIALTQEHSNGVLDQQANELRSSFADIVTLARDVDRLTARWAELCDQSSAAAGHPSFSLQKADMAGLRNMVNTGEELARRAAQVKHALTLPDRDLFRRFYEAINIDQLLATVSDLTRTAAERLRHQELTEQSRQMEARADALALVQSKLDWLKVFVVGFLSIAIIDWVTRHAKLPGGFEDALLLLGAPALFGLAAFILKPWRRKKPAPDARAQRPSWILIALALACVAAWLVGLSHIWSK